MSEIRKATEALRPKFERLNEMVSEMIKNCDKIKQAIRECEVRYQELGNKLRKGDE
jgi:uncharacterized coiled-coil DUF342 family protein